MKRNAELVVDNMDFLVKLVSLAKRKGVLISNLSIHAEDLNNFSLTLDFVENRKSNFVANLYDLDGVNVNYVC
ncbi:MAG: hypothetical protein Q4P25_02790 [Tissierellia bacterium]|nr:hypothetical protein [Tissierellia bacterium]